MIREAVCIGRTVHKDELATNEDAALAARVVQEGRTTPVHLLTEATLQDKGLYRHSAVFGQSGSGKSFMLARLLEELVAGSRARLIVFDYNGDYRYFGGVDPFVFEPTTAAPGKVEAYTAVNSSLVPGAEDDAGPRFNAAWSAAAVRVFGEGAQDPLLLRFQSVASNVKVLRELLSLGPASHPGCLWLLDLIRERCRTYAQWKELSLKLVRWARRQRGEEAKQFAALARTVSIASTIDIAQRLQNALRDALALPIWSTGDARTDLETCVDDLPRALVLDLSSVGSTQARDVVAQYVLDRVIASARNARLREEPMVPTYLVVDEAHNVIPAKGNGAEPLLDRFRMVAAEGRKDGLFLIVGTQRPRKLHQDVLSECDNLCVMRMVSQADVDALRDQFGFVPPALLPVALKLKKGQAIFGGGWTGNRPVIVRVGARRTREGGANLPAQAIVAKPAPLEPSLAKDGGTREAPRAASGPS